MCISCMSMQVALMDRSANVESMQRTVKQLIHQNAEKLLEVGLNEPQVSRTFI